LNLPVCDGHVKAILSVGCVKKKIKNVTLLAGHINKGTATMQLGTTKTNDEKDVYSQKILAYIYF
jgi:hypothetical protein